jgi:hypothetical protein
MEPGVGVDEMVATQAAAYKDANREGRVCLVLGAGNASMLPVTDALDPGPMSRLSFVVFVLATLGTLASAGCKTLPPKTIAPIAKPDHWVQVSAQTPEGAIVSLSVPEDWEDMPGPRPLIARRASTATNDFRSKLGPPRSAAVQILEMAGREGIVVTCSVPDGDAEAKRDICERIFGTFSVTAVAQ